MLRGLALALAALAAAAVRPGAFFEHQTSPIEWRQVDRGLERTAFEVQADPHLWHTRVVAVRLEPSAVTFRLRGRVRDHAPAWTVAHAPGSASVAVNLGMYSGIAPWGWTVANRQEIRPPGVGPLSTALAWDIDGRMLWLAPPEIATARASGRTVEAFHSYPTRLDANGAVPQPLVSRGDGVDVDHRDGRLAIGLVADGRVILALTRFYALGEASPALPIGLTLAEMADVMRRLGCRRAVALDGGISAQLMVREHGRQRIWRGWRAVPFGLIAERIEAAGTQ